MEMSPESGGLLLIVVGVVLASGPVTKQACHRCGVPVSVGFIVVGLLLGAVLRSLGDVSLPVGGVHSWWREHPRDLRSPF